MNGPVFAGCVLLLLLGIVSIWAATSRRMRDRIAPPPPVAPAPQPWGGGHQVRTDGHGEAKVEVLATLFDPARIEVRPLSSRHGLNIEVLRFDWNTDKPCARIRITDRRGDLVCHRTVYIQYRVIKEQT